MRDFQGNVTPCNVQLHTTFSEKDTNPASLLNSSRSNFWTVQGLANQLPYSKSAPPPQRAFHSARVICADLGLSISAQSPKAAFLLLPPRRAVAPPPLLLHHHRLRHRRRFPRRGGDSHPVPESHWNTCCLRACDSTSLAILVHDPPGPTNSCLPRPLRAYNPRRRHLCRRTSLCSGGHRKDCSASKKVPRGSTLPERHTRPPA